MAGFLPAGGAGARAATGLSHIPAAFRAVPSIPVFHGNKGMLQILELMRFLYVSRDPARWKMLRIFAPFRVP